MNKNRRVSLAALLFTAVMAGTGTLQTEAMASSAAATPAVKIKSPAAVKASASVKKTPTPAAVNTVQRIISRLQPSVVGIIGVSTETDDYGDADEYNYSSGKTGHTQESMAHGTGIIVKSNGWILTNAHVIDGIANPSIVTSTGKKYTIDQSYIDEMSDLAVVHINASGLKPAVLAPSTRSVSAGDRVIVLGTPVSFSLRGSATEGIVSGVNRTINAAYKMIQTDAAINPGNSGGPLVNMRGEVIGVNSMKYEATGIDNMGFAIPVATVRYVMDQLFQYGEVHRPGLGLLLEESDDAALGIPGINPLTVLEVNSSRAKQAGFKTGDKIYRVNNTRLNSLTDLNELLKQYKPGQNVTLWTESRGDIIKRTLKLVEAAGDNAEGQGDL